MTAVCVICAISGSAGRSGNALRRDLGGGGMVPKPSVFQLEDGPEATSVPSILISVPVMCAGCGIVANSDGWRGDITGKVEDGVVEINAVGPMAVAVAAVSAVDCDMGPEGDGDKMGEDMSMSSPLDADSSSLVDASDEP